MSKNGLYHFFWTTPLGVMQAIASQEAVYELRFCQDGDAEKQCLEFPIKDSPCPLLKDLCQQVNAYFEGHHKSFDIPFVLVGTDFQKQVWKNVQHLSYGQTSSYQEQAHMIARPKAYRAVGNALAKNSLALLIPCHRVISLRGQRGGYRWGIDTKLALLRHEQKFRR